MSYGPFISKITLPNGQSYDIKDQEARDLIASIVAGGLQFKVSTDAATTPQGITWFDQGVTVTGTLVASGATKAFIYLVPHIKDAETSDVDYYREYVTINFGTEQDPSWAWEFLGDTDIDLNGLGALAWKNDATGSVTFTTADSATFSNGAVTASATYTPAGSVSSTFTGTEMTSTGSVTATGSVSKPNITVTPSTTTGGASKLKTAGSVTAGTAPTFQDGTFDGGSFTQGTDSFTAPELTTSVANETLTIAFSAGSFTQGSDSFTAATRGASTFNAGTTPSVVTLPTFDSVDLLSGVSAELAAAPTFTGNAVNISVSGTPEGSVSSGFTGTEATISSSGSATGDVTLTKTDKTKTVTVS